MEKKDSEEKSNKKEENLSTDIIIKVFKLISKFGSEYDKAIKEWQEFPNTEDVHNEEKFSHYKKKLQMTIKVLLKSSEKKGDTNISRILTFTNNLLQNDSNYNSVLKLNLLLNNCITLLQLIQKSKDDKEINKIMQNYLTNIIRNFIYAYKDKFAYLLLTIANSIAFFNKIDPFFDFEEFFINEDDFLNKKLVPKIHEEIPKINKAFNEDNLIQEFELDKINYENDLDLLYVIQVLYEFDDLLKYKSTYDEKDYNGYKEKIKNKLFNERIQREKGSK